MAPNRCAVSDIPLKSPIAILSPTNTHAPFASDECIFVRCIARNVRRASQNPLIPAVGHCAKNDNPMSVIISVVMYPIKYPFVPIYRSIGPPKYQRKRRFPSRCSTPACRSGIKIPWTIVFMKFSA